jgi:hypothetical protein
MNMKKLVFLLFAVVFFGQQHGFGQCCSPGSPTGGTTNQGSLTRGSLRFISFYQYGRSSGYREGTKESDFNLLKNADFNFLGLNLAYGFTNRFTTDLELGYFLNRTQRYNLPPPDNTLSGNGQSDIVLQGKYGIVKNNVRQIEVTAGAGAGIPCDFKPQEKSGVVLPYDVQPSNQAMSFVGSLFLYKGFLQKKTHLFLVNRVTVPTQNEQDFQAGKSLVTSFFTSYSLAPEWSLIGQIRNEWRSRDRRNAVEVAASGSDLLYFTPQINFNPKQKWNFSLMADFPIYKRYHGVQLDKDYNVAVIVSRTFEGRKWVNPGVKSK